MAMSLTMMPGGPISLPTGGHFRRLIPLLRLRFHFPSICLKDTPCSRRAILSISQQFLRLRKDAFPDVYDPMVDAGEPVYREMLTQYGLILLMPESTAIEMLASQLAHLAV